MKKTCARIGVTFLVSLHLGLAYAAEEFVFSAPPRGTPSAEGKVYGPVAEYLSRATGKHITYRHPGNWLSYQNDMQRGVYDLVFDGPHFLAWRMARTGHEPLVKLPGKLAFVAAIRNDNDNIKQLSDLGGRTVCGLAPPNLATLTLYAQFDNPVRQPLIVETKSFKVAYREMLKGKLCAAVVMRDTMFFKLNKKEHAAKVIWHSGGVANQGFSAGPRFTSEDKAKMTEALLKPEARTRLVDFLARFNKRKALERATRGDYEGLAALLKDVYGFDLAHDATAR